MAAKGDSEGFVSSPLEGQGVRHKDSYYPMSGENTAFENLKAILIERRGLTTPERVNKVISGKKLGSGIPSTFRRRLQKPNRLYPIIKLLLGKMFQQITKKIVHPNAPPPQIQQNNVAQSIDTADAPVCFYHQTFGDRAGTCREPCAFSNRPEQGSDSCIWRNNRGATWLCESSDSQLISL